MLQFLRENNQFYIVILLWVIGGIIAPEIAMVLIPIGLILFKRKEMYAEMIVSFAMLLFFSDNRQPEFAFAGETKDIALIVMSAFVLLDAKSFKEKSKIWYPFLAFFILAFIVIFRNPYPLLAFQKTLSFFLMLALIPNYVTHELAKDEGKHLFTLWIWSGTLLFLAGFVVSVVMPVDYTFLVGRYNGLLGNPNGIGSFATIFFALIMLTLQKHPKLFTLPQLILIFGALALSVLLSESRNSIFSILIFLFFARFYKLSPMLGFVILIITGLLYEIITENLPLIVNALGLGSYLRVEHLEDGSGRLIAWQFGWEKIQDNFLLGKGFSYEETLFDVNQKWLQSQGTLGGVHNTYLALWLNTGLIGLILYLVGLLSNFLKSVTYNYLSLPTLFAFLFSCTFEAWFQGSLNPFTIMALACISLLHFRNVEKEENTVPVL
ncbi:MAG: O-antigen ligase family protein [Bacteroidota bacterium]